MEVKLISLATPNYAFAARILRKSAGKYNINTQIFTGREFSKTSFYKENFEITKLRKGFGYWLWKPYYILQSLLLADDGDIIIYSDACHEIISNPDVLINLAEKKEMLLFENYQGSFFISETNLPFTEYNFYTEINKTKYWTKTSAAEKMMLTGYYYENSPTVDASFLVLKKCENTIAFITEWLSYCTNRDILTDDNSGYGKHNIVIEHRHDQSILSLLAAKYKLELFRCPSQFGNHYKLESFQAPFEEKILPYSGTPMQNSKYPTITFHNRQRVDIFLKRLERYLKYEWSYLKKAWKR